MATGGLGQGIFDLGSWILGGSSEKPVNTGGCVGPGVYSGINIGRLFGFGGSSGIINNGCDGSGGRIGMNTGGGIGPMLFPPDIMRGQKDTWEYALFFDPRADKIENDIVKIKQEYLKDELDDLVDVSEKIISVYAHKAEFKQTVIPFHVFIVFETAKWWWSIEKTPKGITLQRARSRKSVKEGHLKEKRTQELFERIKLVEKDEASRTKSIKSLINFLYDNKVLQIKYDAEECICKHVFGMMIFNYLSKEKTLRFDN